MSLLALVILLEEVLKYHVLVGDFSYDELQDGGRFETAQGERVKVSTDEEDDYDDLYALTVDGEKYVGRYDRSCRVDGGKGDFDKDEDVTLAECQEKCTDEVPRGDLQTLDLWEGRAAWRGKKNNEGWY